MSGFVMGLDGGSSKSHLALFDTDGKRIGFEEWGALNHEGMRGGFDQLERELGELIGRALSHGGLRIDDCARGVFGMSGVDTRNQQAAISAMYRRLGVREPVVVNDAYLPIRAVSTSGRGIGAINGSGCTVAGIGADGTMLQIGGCGGLTGDLGGGSEIGMSVVRAAYQATFKGGEPTMLRDMLFERIGIEREEDFLDVLAERMADGSASLSTLNRLMFEAAGRGDALARRLLTEIGEDSAMAIGGALARLSFPEGQPIDVALAGSVYVKASDPTLVDALKRKAIQLAGDRVLRFTVTATPPVAGAVVWALDGLLPASEAIARVTRQLQP